ncbi:MAG TPA: ectonucleotide pyrophosphatase/phosphodiesterase [Vicinamibacteria bacterium]|nr:ectonucleotide pyrophosphatase/phosphodiesterase [Vicinamibacteria bacterium]
MRGPTGVIRRTAAALLAASAAVAVAAPAAPRGADHVVLISIDGLLPEYYIRPQDFGLSLPNLQALREAGSWAEAVVGQYPSVTYPSHTSMVTGMRPARHGIISNTRFDPERGSTQWYREAEALKAPALWQVASGAGLKTAALSWPVTVGARIDALIPESQAAEGRSWLDTMRGMSTAGLVDDVVKRLGGFGPDDHRDIAKRDRFFAAATVHVLKTHQPNLLLLHLVQTDSAQHRFGRHSPEAKAAFTAVDGLLGEILRATEEAGIRPRTTFVVTGDHGFYRVHSTLQPNVVLRRAGLLQTGADGTIQSWQAAAHGGAVRVKDPADRALADRAEALFRALADGRYRGLFRVVDRQELDALGAYPEAAFFVEPVDGYMVSGGFEGDDFVAPTATRGSHGYLPDQPALHTGLILSGAGVRPGLVVPRARQLDVGPTIARLLGLDMGDTEGAPMLGLLAGTATP